MTNGPTPSPSPHPVPVARKPSAAGPIIVIGVLAALAVTAGATSGLMLMRFADEPSSSDAVGAGPAAPSKSAGAPPAAEALPPEPPPVTEPASSDEAPPPPSTVDAPQTPLEADGASPARSQGRTSRAAERPRPQGEVGSRVGGLPDAPPPDEPPPLQPLRVGGNIPQPAKTRHVVPVYPQIAQSARVQGTVIIEATIDRDGKVRDARVLRSIPLLDQSALDAVQQWEYEPTRLNGVPVPVIVTVTVRFALD